MGMNQAPSLATGTGWHVIYEELTYSLRFHPSHALPFPLFFSPPIKEN